MKNFFDIGVNSLNSEFTEQIAESIGRNLKGGEIIELIGDLGSGKTTFVRGLSKGLGSQDHVASPTFTISRLYKSGNLSLHHMDFYRLSDPGTMRHDIEESMSDKNSIVVIEWPEITQNILPKNRITIRFKIKADDKRTLNFHYSNNYNYLFKDIEKC